MKKLKIAGLILGVVIIGAFLAFLTLIPPFTVAPPEDFITPQSNAAPLVTHGGDAGREMITERGRYLVMALGCAGCHTPGGDKGPKFDTEYLAGGLKFTDPRGGTSISRNLTPDPATGLARRSDDQVKKTLRSGVSADDGRIFYPLFMPWADFSGLTEEDRHAIVTYLRTLKPVNHKIPEHSSKSESDFYGFFGQDYGIHQGQ